MLRYKLRTLLIVLALGPPMLAVGWTKYSAWVAEQQRELKDIRPGFQAVRNIQRPTPPAATNSPADVGPWYGGAGSEGPPGFGQPPPPAITK